MDIILTVTSPWLYAPVPVRELHQFHSVIIVTATEVSLETWNTQKDWEHVSS